MTGKRNKRNHVGKKDSDDHNKFGYKFDIIHRIKPDQTINQPMSYKEINQFIEGIPILHLAQHKLADKENVDPYYRQQLADFVQPTQVSGKLSPDDEKIADEVGQAMSEKDVIDLRASLSRIIAETPVCEYQPEEIERYLNNDLPEETVLQFEQKITGNRMLAEDIDLRTAIDQACQEKDIMQLRAQLQTITDREHSQVVKIEHYIHHDLSPKDRIGFEQELARHPEWQKDILLQQEIDQACQETDILHLREQLRTLGRQNNRISPREHSRIYRLPQRKILSAAIAASIVLFAGTKFFLEKNNSPSTIQSLYQHYYSPYPATETTRSGNHEEENSITVALREYHTGDYLSSLKSLEKILIHNPEDPVANFYSAMCYQQKQNYTQAIQYYEKVINEKDNLFVEQAKWYSSLCLMESGETRQAKIQLQTISSSNEYYSSEATALLTKLNNH